MLKKLKASMGAGGASIQTDLTVASAAPGGAVKGVIVVTGGEVEQDIKYIAVGLQAIVEVEGEDSEWDAKQSFAGDALTGPFKVHPGFRQEWKFDLTLPWETPFNVVDGGPLHGVRLGVETELEIEKAVDKGDLDPIQVTALPCQAAVLNALRNDGWRFKSSDLERGRIKGGVLPFYQEVEFAPSPQFAGQINELEVTFITNERTTRVILEADRRGGMLSSGGDAYMGFEMPTSGGNFDVDGALRQSLSQLGRR